MDAGFRCQISYYYILEAQHTQGKLQLPIYLLPGDTNVELRKCGHVVK